MITTLSTRTRAAAVNQTSPLNTTRPTRSPRMDAKFLPLENLPGLPLPWTLPLESKLSPKRDKEVFSSCGQLSSPVLGLTRRRARLIRKTFAWTTRIGGRPSCDKLTRNISSTPWWSASRIARKGPPTRIIRLCLVTSKTTRPPDKNEFNTNRSPNRKWHPMESQQRTWLPWSK